MRYIILFLVIFISCNGKDAVGNANNDWKRDSIGCKNLRSPELAEKLIIENHLKDKNIDDFIAVFGKPNKSENDLLGKKLIYYFSTVCEGNILIKDGDKCYAEFYFTPLGYESCGFICE